MSTVQGLKCLRLDRKKLIYVSRRWNFKCLEVLRHPQTKQENIYPFEIISDVCQSSEGLIWKCIAIIFKINE